MVVDEDGMTAPERLRFDAFEFDTDVAQLWHGDVRVTLEPRALRLLATLLAAPNQTVTRERLMREVWDSDPRQLSRNVLSNAVGKLRQALGEPGNRLIVAVPGLGYRLSATVVPIRREDDLCVGMALPGMAQWHLQAPLSHGGNHHLWRVVTVDDPALPARRGVARFVSTTALREGLRLEQQIAEALSAAHGAAALSVPLIAAHLDAAPYYLLWKDAGDPLDIWLARNGGEAWAESERLSLFLQAVDAVAQAQQLGVLHCDLKPSCLLVSGSRQAPRLRLADFGSAQSAHPPTLPAPTDDVPRTPSTSIYLAPERAGGGVTTLGSDVYSLGLLLYQLLVGDFQRPIAAGWEQHINDPVLRADLLRMLHGQPEHRLASAQDLALLMRSLPQRRQARRDALLRQERRQAVQRSLRRWRVLSPWLSALGVVMLVVFAVSLHFAQQARRQAAAAQIAAQQATAVANLMIRGLLPAANPFVSGTVHVRLADALQMVAQQSLVDVDLHPAVRAQVLLLLADDLRRLGRETQARALAEQALALASGAAPLTRQACEVLAKLGNAAADPRCVPPPVASG